MGTWNRKVVEILIYLYKKHPLLYDCKAIGYGNKKERYTVLIAIAKELSKRRPTSVYEIKKKIKTLRSQYSAEKSLIEKSNKPGSFNVYQPKLWCFEYLRFLDKHIKKKPHDVESSNEGRLIRVVPSLNVEADFDLSDDSDVDNAFTSLVKSSAFIRLGSKNSRDTREDFDIPIVKTEPSEVSGNGDKHDIFGRYIASELREITDERLLFETKVAIQGIINDAKIRLLDAETVYGTTWTEDNIEWCK